MYQHRQIHVWISESDYLMLREQSDMTRESVSALIRRMIKNERQRMKLADAVQIESENVSNNCSQATIELFAS